MRPLLLAAMLGGSALPAHAGTVSLTVTMASGTCSAGCTKSFTVADADILTLIQKNQADCAAQSATGSCTLAQGAAQFFSTIGQRVQSDIYQWNVRNASQAVATPSVQ